MIDFDYSEERPKGRTAFAQPFDVGFALDGTVVEVPTAQREGLDLDGLAYPNGVPGSSEPETVRRFMSKVVDTVPSDDPVFVARQRVAAAIDATPPRSIDQL